MALRFQIELEFGNVGFLGEGKTGVAREKPLGARTRTNNKLNPPLTPSPGIEPGHIGGRQMLNHCAIPAPRNVHCCNVLISNLLINPISDSITVSFCDKGLINTAIHQLL